MAPHRAAPHRLDPLRPKFCATPSRMRLVADAEDVVRSTSCPSLAQHQAETHAPSQEHFCGESLTLPRRLESVPRGREVYRPVAAGAIVDQGG